MTLAKDIAIFCGLVLALTAGWLGLLLAPAVILWLGT